MDPIKTILVPIDFSETSDHALDYAVDLASTLKARLHVITAWEVPIAGFPDGLVVATAELVSKILEENDKGLAQLKEKYKSRNVEIATEVLQADPRDAILSAAKRTGANLIVMGTHGRRGITRALIGSVAESVVRMSPVPVLMVRAPAKA